MTSTALRELASRIRGEVRFDEPLAGYTTYRIGGPAAAMVLPATTDDVVQALQFAAQTGTRWLALGLGSNVLIADGGFDGIVIRLGKGLDAVERGAAGDATRWTLGAGVPTPLLARQTAEAGLAGVHRLVGVPGTVAGLHLEHATNLSVGGKEDQAKLENAFEDALGKFTLKVPFSRMPAGV